MLSIVRRLDMHSASLRDAVLWLQFLALLVSRSACLVAVDATKTTNEDIRLAAFTERFFRWRLEQTPEYGTLFGIHDYDDRVDQYTEAAFREQMANATLMLADAESTFDRRNLTRKSRVTLDTLRYNLRTFIDGYEFRRYGMYNPISPLETPVNDWVGIASLMKFENEPDYRKFISRLRLLPVRVDQLISMMRQAIRNNITVHNVSLTGAVKNIRSMIVDNTTVSYSALFSIPFDHYLISSSPVPQKTWLALMAEVKQLLLGSVNEAWIRLHNFVVDEYSQYTRTNVSASSLPGGLEYYEACLRWHTTTNLTAAQIFRKGLDEVDRIWREKTKIMHEEGFNGSVSDFTAMLYEDTNNFYNTSDELLQGYRVIINRVHSKLHLVLKKNPQVAVGVKSSINSQGPAGSYQGPPLDLSRPGEFIANVFHPQSTMKGTMVALTLHEAEPGHHTQAVYGVLSDLPLFRRAIDYRRYHAIPFNWPFFTGYVEGWALYAESLGEEIGVYTDRLTRFGHLSSEMLRAVRLVVDTGIHAFGWSKEQAVKYFEENTEEPPVMIEIEVNRYISWPGQACAYKIGELTIRRLRDEAQRKLGEGNIIPGPLFDLRDFNDFVLDLGPVPLSVLEMQVELWIDDVTNISGPKNTPSLSLGSVTRQCGATAVAALAVAFLLQQPYNRMTP